jgi:tRNA(fMet)-specific endonuclease VapC
VSRYCLDTVAYSHFKRGDWHLAEMLDQAEWIGFPVIVIGELQAGFTRGARLTRNLAELDEFLALPVVETLPVTRQIAEIFGELIADLRTRGTPVPTNDIWIAATCIRAGATLLTWDGHFRLMPRCRSIVFPAPATPA